MLIFSYELVLHEDVAGQLLVRLSQPEKTVLEVHVLAVQLVDQNLHCFWAALGEFLVDGSQGRYLGLQVTHCGIQGLIFYLKVPGFDGESLVVTARLFQYVLVQHHSLLSTIFCKNEMEVHILHLVTCKIKKQTKFTPSRQTRRAGRVDGTKKMKYFLLIFSVRSGWVWIQNHLMFLTASSIESAT